MDLFTYLMAKKGHNTGRDLFSYLLGKNAGGSGTYTTFSGISLNISNTLKAPIKNLKLNPTEITQTGTPTPDSPVDVNVIKGNNTITISNSDNTQSQNFSINLGNLEYAKFGDYEDEFIRTTGKNLFDKDNATYLDNANVSSSSVINIENNFALIYLKLKAGTYNISNDIGSYQWLISDCEDIPVIGESTSPRQVVTETNTTYTLSSERYLLIRVAKSTISINDFIQKLQITEGEEMLPYEPYGVNEWYLKENVGKITLDGTQTIGSINLDQENTTRVTYISIITNGINTIPLLCNRLERKNNFNSDEEGIYYNATNGNLFFRINKTLIGTTTNEINTYLTNNNIKLYYPMSSPTITQITDTTLIEQLENISNNAKSYQGVTNITQTNDDLPFNISVDVKVKKEAGKLPDDYQEVEYIQSTGTQYINTGVLPDVTIEFEIDYAITQTVQWETLIGSDPDRTMQFYFGIVSSSSVKKNYIYVGTSNKTFTNNYGELDLKTKAVYSNGSITITNTSGSVTETLSNVSMASNSLPLYLFALNRQNVAADNSYVKIYSAILNKNNEKVRELVPCYRKSDNVIGLYDLVNETFYTNAGTGTFLKGNDIN